MKNIIKISFGVGLLLNVSAHAEITTDGTLGVISNLSGQMQIPQSLGTTAGNNLFHSFQTFNINTGETATFTGSNAIQNVISRVTGGQVSNIDGLLKSEIPNANFYFINPAGVTFGANAQVDVPAAFHVSTADNLKFADGKIFSAVDVQASTLSIAEPASFGFLNNSLTNTGNITLTGTTLAVKNAQTLDLVGRNLDLKRYMEVRQTLVCGDLGCFPLLSIVLLPVNLSAPAGEIRLVAVNEQGDVNVQPGADGKTPLPTSSPSVSNAGSVSLEMSHLNADGAGAGRIAVWGNQVILTNGTTLTANNTADTNATAAKGLEIVANDLQLSGDLKISSDAAAAGNAANINVSANTLTLLNNAQISSKTDSTGNAGKITVNAQNLTLQGIANTKYSSGIFTDSYGAGKAGDVLVNAEQIEISQSGWIGSIPHSAGAGGNVDINANILTLSDKNSAIGTVNLSSAASGDVNINVQELKIFNAARITSESGLSFNANRVGLTPGNLTIQAKNILLSNTEDNPLMSTITSVRWPGTEGAEKGTMIITADSLEILGHSDISSTTFSKQGSDINVTAKQIKIDGKLAGIHAGTSYEGGNSGNININSQSLTILHGGSVFASTESYLAGNAGNININADQLTLNGIGVSGDFPTGILSDIHQSNSFATIFDSRDGFSYDLLTESAIGLPLQNILSPPDRAAGDISISTHHLTMQGGALISAASIISPPIPNSNSTSYGTQTGAITIQARDAIQLSEQAEISNRSDASGAIPDYIFYLDGNQLKFDIGLSSGVYYFGQASKAIALTAPIISLDNSKISSNTNSLVTGGAIEINASQFSMVNDSVVSSSSTSGGDAGNILINASDNVLLQHSQLSGFTVGQGDSGNIEINTHHLNLDQHASVSVSSSSLAPSGNITLNAAEIEILNDSEVQATNSASGAAGFIDIKNNTNLTLNHHANLSVSLSEEDKSTQVIDTPLINPVTGLPFTRNEMLAQLGSSDPTLLKAIKFFTNGNEGDAGNVSIGSQHIVLDDVSSIRSNTNARGKAGDVAINSPAILLQNNSEISALAGQNSSGKTGRILLENPDVVSLNSGGKISVQNDGTAADPAAINAPDLVINVPHLSLNGGLITAATSGNVNAGNVLVSSQNPVTMSSLAVISSATFGSGNAGNVVVTAPVINLDNASIKASTEAGSTGTAGSVIVNATQKLNAANFASITTASLGQGKAGDVTVRTSLLALDSSAEISALAGANSQGETGVINLIAESIKLTNAAKVSVQNGGISAHPALIKSQNLVIDVPFLTLDGGIITAATSGNVDAGNVVVKTLILSMTNGASINSNATGVGNAGNVSINAPIVMLDHATIAATAELGSSGNAGSVTVTAADWLIENNQASINSSTFGAGKAGDVTINSPAIFLHNDSEISALAGQGSSGQTGRISLENPNLVSLNSGGKISVQNDGIANNPASVKSLDLVLSIPILMMDGGVITAETSGNVTAGNVNITTATPLRMDSLSSITSNTSGSADAGNVFVRAPAISINNGSTISTSTASTTDGNAGTVTLTADAIEIDGQHNPAYTGVFSDSYANSDNQGVILNAGNANKVTVNAKTLHLLNSGKMSSSTWSKGKAGDVTLNVEQLSIAGSDTGLFAAAKAGSSGQTGEINVNAQTVRLTDNGKISIQNDAVVANPSALTAGLITLSATDIFLKNSAITAESTGNVDAGDIALQFSQRLNLDQSFVTTSATDGNGGAISINGIAPFNLMVLQNSGFLTSVTGAAGNGNGGNIDVSAHTLIMNSSVIQANAVSGTGGDIALNLQALIPSYDSLIKGGAQVVWQPFVAGFNVIQAASATGVSGSINLTSPQFNISGSISGLDSAPLVLPSIDHTACQGSTHSASTLVRGSKGGIPNNEAQHGMIPMAIALSVAESLNSENSLPTSALTIEKDKENNPYPCATTVF